MTPLELWGGHECTLNRVGGAYRDQSVLSGHHQRLDDIDRLADLGVRSLRYPLLWEKSASVAGFDWSWADLRFDRLRQRGVHPIAGLVHHGAGPRHATLLTDRFAPGLAAFAGEAARRYPWIEAWTPVNEPLTTAKFSALYGHWHPHKRDERLFWTALLNQIDGVRLSMRAIRLVNPDAKLVQTEDMGRTYSTLATSHQAAFDNVRRWMTWDLLFGRVTTDHPLWLRLARMGFAARLSAIADDPCEPDIVGINHYLTSDRFLDERVELYPSHAHGGNRFMRYADVEAIRVVQPAPPSLQNALEEVWQRYEAPIALTEVHNGSTREEQLRWFDEAWSTAETMRGRGVDIRAVTAWSLLGALDWNSLLTRDESHYEPGAFDVRSLSPRRTALADLIASIGCGTPAPIGWRGEGWWRRDIRLNYAPVHPCQDVPLAREGTAPSQTEPPLLIVGATGTLGRALARACAWRGIRHVLVSRRDFALSDEAAIGSCLDARSPWAVINAAGYVRVDEAENDEQVCHEANTIGVANLAKACADRGIHFVTFSSDLVFDGQKRTPYVESDIAGPLNAYGRSKQKAEDLLLSGDGKNLVIRTAAFFSPHDPHNFAAAVVRELSAGNTIDASDDVVSPTYVPDLANAVLDLLLDGETGIWHLTNRDAGRTWAQFGRDIARVTGLPEQLVIERSASEMPWTAQRPHFAALTSERGLVMPTLDAAIECFAETLGRTLVTPEVTDTPELSFLLDAG